MISRLMRSRLRRSDTRGGNGERSATDVLAVLGPDSVQVSARHINVGEQLAATLTVTGYPAEVAPGWLEPLLTYPGRLDVALHIDPVPNAVAADRLRKQRARLESTRRAAADKGSLDDPSLEAAAEDAAELARSVARGEGRLFRVGLYLTVHATDPDTLAEEVAAVRAIADSLLLATAPTTFRALHGWLTTRPFGCDLLQQHRTFDTHALAAAFPFASPDLPAIAAAEPGRAPAGVLYGANLDAASLVLWDRWSCDNYNSITLARSGAGKSYLTKLDVLRSLYQGVQVAVIDPEDEYTRLAGAVGGTVIDLGAPGVRLNPFDLPAGDAASDEGEGMLTRRALFLHSLLAVLLGSPPTATERAVLDTAILTAYAAAGITADPATWHHPAPQLTDLAHHLHATSEMTGRQLAERLAPFTTGTHKDLFDGPTTTAPDGHLLVFNLRHLPDELKAAGMMLTLDALWRRTTSAPPGVRNLMVVDEAWRLMADGAGAAFLFRVAKAARKRAAGLAVVTQDAADVLATDLGKAVVSNAATQILLKQAPQAIDTVAESFHLSDGERQFLLSAARGEGLLLADRHSVAFTALASPEEDILITTEPGFAQVGAQR